MLTNISRLFCVTLLAIPVGVFAGVTVDAEGWTRITPSADSHLVYVSSSEGNDANDGFTPATPKATIAAADALIRDGYPDHLLLKRGDTFVATEDRVLRRWKNGRSADEPLLLSYYGHSGPRPVVRVRTSLVDHDGQARHYQAFIGVDVYRAESDPDAPEFNSTSSTTAMRMVGGGANLLIEDCRFRYCGITLQSFGANAYTDVRFRRNIVFGTWRHNSYNSNAGVQGMYVSGMKGTYLIEENFFDHNGWSEVVPGAGANMFNHNLYVQYSNVAGGVFRGNVFARGAAHGLQARSGGVVDRNVFVLNAVSLNLGGNHLPTDPAVYDFDNRAVHNVVLNGRRMDPANGDYPRTAAVWGIVASYIGEVDVIDNIVANRVDSGNNRAIMAITPEQPVSINAVDNVVHQWWSEQDQSDASWPHPDADLGDFFASIGGTDSTEDYLAWMRERGVGTMPWSMTAYAAINYIRAGFLREPVSSVYAHDVLWNGDFEPANNGGLAEMPEPYVVGESDGSAWFARTGHNALSSQLAEDAGDHFVDVGSSNNTNGTFEVIPWPGDGAYVLNLDYRSANAYVRVFGADGGDTIDRGSSAHTLTLLEQVGTQPSNTQWSAASHDVHLNTDHEFLVVSLRRGDFDNVSLLKLPFDEVVE